jgi:NAD(P)-dependent dehydrogenase (short-subunit alcohol dehydrogenase family)
MSTIAVVTGASQGIGAAIAMRLAAEPNLRLALVARRKGKLEEIAEQCRDCGAQVSVYPCDLTDEAAVQSMAQAVQQDLGTPDLLVNNAGRFVRADLRAMDKASFLSVIDVNLTSAFLVTRNFIDAMEKQKSGTIFFMGSVAGLQAYPESGAYCVAKHGMLGLARAFRACAKGSGLRITAIMPGATESPSWDLEKHGENRLMPAADIAEAVTDIFRLSERTVVEEIVLRPLGGDV